MDTLPHGTVTFLLTAIKGSASQWETNPTAMAEAIAAHERTARHVVAQHQGRVFKTVGDELFCVFATPAEALVAAHALQQGHDPRFPVHVAVHTGVATEREGDYHGAPLNLVARLLEMAAGDQVLVSRTTVSVSLEELPAPLSLRYLGTRAIRGLERHERIYALEGPGLQAGELVGSEPLVEVRGLPTPRTELLGRDAILHDLRETLVRSDVRMVTLTGPGGSGKTRLAIQLGREMAPHFQQGVTFVDLIPIRDPDYVPTGIASALGLREPGNRSTREFLSDALRDLHLLLILDNFEHLLSATPIVSHILRVAPSVTILVTSRATLQIAGERDYPVPPLELPAPAQQAQLDRLRENPAVALFAHSARANKPDFALTATNAEAVAEICRRLDGLPLAIELAAARTTVLSPPHILARLDHRLSLLTRGPRDLPARQQTLRDTIAWSYDLLTPPEQETFRRLAAFNGGCTLEAAEAVLAANDDERINVLDLLASLLDKSLLRAIDLDTEEPRFTMLETVREFAEEQLRSADEHETRCRHAEYWLGVAKEAELGLRGPRQLHWFRRLDADYGNIRASMEWSLSPSGPREIAQQLGGVLGWYWFQRGLAAEAHQWLERILATVPPDEVSPERARLAYALGSILYLRSEYQGCARAFGECAALGQALLLPAIHGAGLAWVAVLTQFGGDSSRALELIGEAQAQLFQSGDRWLAAGGMFILGIILDVQDRTEGAGTAYREAIAVYRDLGDRWGVASPTVRLGHLAFRTNHVDEAEMHFVEGLSMLREVNDPVFMSRAIDGLALVAHARGVATRAARLFGAAQQLRDQTGVTLLFLDQPVIDRVQAELRARLGPRAFDEARDLGAKADFAEIVAEVLDSRVAS